jgi:hypothetical protein
MLPLTILGVVSAVNSAVSSVPGFCAFEDSLFPPHYVTYKAASGSIKVDGRLDEPAWAEVDWTTPNRDICGPSPCSHGPARFETRQKVRWDDEFLYIAAFLEEPQVRLFSMPLTCRPRHTDSLGHVLLHRYGRITPSTTA